MADPKGFLKYKRQESGYRSRDERVHDYHQVEKMLPEEERIKQAARCMDCGVPFCHWGCPLESKIPEWQDAIYQRDWKTASDILHSTNIFPEFTGTVCPGLCEAPCVLSINDAPVTIRANELAVVSKAFDEGYLAPVIPARRSGKKVAVVGSGPCGLVVAEQLNRLGHSVTVFEQDDRAGGLLRYGIPDFKLEKWVIERRIELMVQSGIEFRLGCGVGRDIAPQELVKSYDAVCLAIGAMQPRDLSVPGRELAGVHFAMEFLTQQNRRVAGDVIPQEKEIHAKGKHVVIIGGGDTGSDCVGTSNRHGALSVTQIEVLPRPPERKNASNPNWPNWPTVMRTSSSHEEGCERRFALSTKEILGENGHVKKLHVVEVTWSEPDAAGRRNMIEVPGSDLELPADLVLLAMGFIHPVHKGAVESLGLQVDPRGNVAVDGNQMTSVPGVFAAGDATSGASLVVRAMASGKRVAKGIDRYLQTQKGAVKAKSPEKAAV